MHQVAVTKRIFGNRKSWVSGFAVMVILGGMAILILASGCASNYSRPLISRGLPAQERKDYIIQNGFGIPENVKQAFLEGYPLEGMSREMVFQLFGNPDRTSEKEANWEYVNNRGTLITGITFKNDKVEKIYGDPKGGAISQGEAGAGD